MSKELFSDAEVFENLIENIVGGDMPDYFFQTTAGFLQIKSRKFVSQSCFGRGKSLFQ